MTLVTVPQAQPNDELTDDLINRGSNAIAAVLNGNVDDDNISSLSGTKISAGTLPVSALDTDQDDLTPADGWLPANETWTYVSASTFTVPGDQTARYTAGVKLKYVQSASTKYSEVASSSYSAPNTTVTILSSYSTLANSAISDNFISRVGNPQGMTQASLIGFYATTTASVNATQSTITSYTEVADYGGNFASGTFTAPVNGFYHFDFGARISDVSTDNRFQCFLYVNGNVVQQSLSVSRASTHDPAVNISIDIPMSAGQTAYIQGYSEVGAKNMSEASFSGHLIGRTS